MIKIGVISFAVLGMVLFSGSADADVRGFTDPEMDSFVAAMISVDCVANTENAEKVEDATGFSEDKLKAIVAHLENDRLIVEAQDGESIELINEGCP